MYSNKPLVFLGLSLLYILCVENVHAQESQLIDSLPLQYLKEVVLGASKLKVSKNSQSVLGSLDQYLENARGVAMLKRGGYAWEPQLFSMGSERLNLTIDGMKIYGACTDKMDPVSAYVSVANIQKLELASGQDGAAFGPAIAGSINLSVADISYGIPQQNYQFSNGMHSNANGQQWEGLYKVQDSAYFLGLNLSKQSAQNYSAGARQAPLGYGRVLYSQFEKENAAFQAGIKLRTHESVEVLYIFDRATDVGYPALPMDVSVALAHIGSLSYKNSHFKSFDNFIVKAYANSIVHHMDDSQRPDVPIRMDMPGWNKTLGFLSELSLKNIRQEWFFKLEGHYNFAEANMTMYPNNPEEKEMFMLTWPLVKTYQAGVFVSHRYALSPGNTMLSSWRATFQRQGISSDMGLESLQIFYPHMNAYDTHLFSNVSVGYEKQASALLAQFKLGYGERPLSVSESYGFYLFNSFDNHDYIGNPEIAKEVAWSVHLDLNSVTNKHVFSASVNGFYFPKYVMGVIDPLLQEMTIGAAGVKKYEAIPNAFIYDLSLEDKFSLSSVTQLGVKLSYSRGLFKSGTALPFMAPLQYELFVNAALWGGNIHLDLKAAATQSHFNVLAGEDATPAYEVINAFYKRNFDLAITAAKPATLSLQLGIENLLDQYYSTYLDWNNVPRMGRNILINTTINF